jgi:hypothetical protein
LTEVWQRILCINIKHPEFNDLITNLRFPPHSRQTAGIHARKLREAGSPKNIGAANKGSKGKGYSTLVKDAERDLIYDNT